MCHICFTEFLVPSLRVVLYALNKTFLVLFKYTVSARSGSVRGAPHQPHYVSSCQTINHKCLDFVPSGIVRKFPCIT